MTNEEKWELYHAGKYVFVVPATYHGNWTDQDWFNYVDRNNGWRPNMK